MIPQIPIIEDSVSLLTSQFEGSAVVEGALSVFLSSLQGVANGMGQLLNERGIALAYGDRLDQIGKIVGIDRQGRQDGAYKQAILNRVIVNNGEATPDDAMSAIKVSTLADNVETWEHYPACSIFMTDGTANQDTPVVAKNVTPAGVTSGLVIWNEYGEAHRPVDLDGAALESTWQYLPEYNEDASIYIPASTEEGKMLIGRINDYMLIDTASGSGKLLVSSERGAYTIYQGIFPDIFTLEV